MDDSGPTVSIISFILILLVDMVFYGFGAAIHTLNTKEIEQKALENKDKKSIRLSTIILNPTKYVNSVQMVVTFLNILIGGYYFDRLFGVIFLDFKNRIPDMMESVRFPFALFCTAIILLYAILTFGVLLPKKLAVHFPNQWAYGFITPVYYVTKILTPFTVVVTFSANVLARIAGIHPKMDVVDVTEEEIISMVNEGHEQGVLQASEAEMITNIFEFGDKEAKDIMTHRKSIIGIDANMSLRNAIGFMLSERNSRYPVFEENIDHIIGILHFKDAMRMQAGASEELLDKPLHKIRGLLREVTFIPETKNIDALFQNMQSGKVQMVIVVDEYGQTVGLVAMEDILEEIVGNIMDEYDIAEEHIARKNENEYVIDGVTPLKELEGRFAIVFDLDEVETINGYLIAKMEKIPEENETFEIRIGEYLFRILSVKDKMIQSVLVTKVQNDESDTITT